MIAESNVTRLNGNVFETLMDSLQEGVYFVDRHRTIHYWNQGAERLTGYRREEVMGRCCASNILSHVYPDGKPACNGTCPLVLAMMDGCPRRVELYLRHKDGHRLPVVVRTSPIRNESGEVIGALESFTDNTSHVAALERIADLEHQALMCPLTLVGNRRYSEMVLQEKLAEWARYEQKFGAVFVDVDDFKVVNDLHGHTVGDLALKTVANTIRNDLRTFDYVGRWGGEEFLVLLHTGEPEVLKNAADRLRVLVSTTARLASETKIALTVSVGGTLVNKGDTAQSVVQRADEAMYASKRHGKNRLTIF